jgi:peptidoglycan hydrolase-like protein with peptidoglycan-binding domain
MASITASVGMGGVNRDPDARTVQGLINRHIAKLGLTPLKVDGRCGQRTMEAIRAFQTRVMMLRMPDGRVDPGGRTIRALDSGAPGQPAAPQAPASAADVARRSGTTWWRANQARFPNSSAVADLAAPFRTNVESFLAALRAGGATVSVSATKRNEIRAYLMHYSWKISKGTVNAADVPAKAGCDIIWDHGDVARSRAGAREMVDLFGIVYQPSLTSLHIAGRAIDMNIDWSGTLSIKDASGKAVSLGAPSNGSNTALHAVGVTYGVRKLLSDPPHWSDNGH